MPYKNYTKEFKEKAVSLALSSDAPISQTAKELDVKESTLYSWVTKAGESSKTAGGNQEASVIDEIKKLKKELAQVKEERDILKKAVSIFSKSDRKSTGS